MKYGVKNFITIGTSLPENINLYSFSKHKFSEFGKYLCTQDGLNFIDLRLEMFYGGLFEPDNRFISSCRIKLINNEELFLTEGLQKRDIVRVEDVVRLINNIINHDYIHGYKVLPVGSGEQHSIREIINYMKEKLNSNSRLNFGAIASREGEPNTLADISWYNEIGFSLEYDFFTGLAKECEI